MPASVSAAAHRHSKNRTDAASDPEPQAAASEAREPFPFGRDRRRVAVMAWVKVPPENHPLFLAALPNDPRVETKKMFGGVAATVQGNLFAGLFGRSTMIWLPEPERAAALALDGAALFDPMGDGRARSDKIMLPESVMREPVALRKWVARAFKGAAALPAKAEKKAKAAKNAPAEKAQPAKKATKTVRKAAKAPKPRAR
jgi:TfoX/Sxy family transcriptional regulator of competence genes